MSADVEIAAPAGRRRRVAFQDDDLLPGTAKREGAAEACDARPDDDDGLGHQWTPAWSAPQITPARASG